MPVILTHDKFRVLQDELERSRVKLICTRDTARQFFRRCPVLGLLLEQPSDSFFGGMLLFPKLHYTPVRRW